MKKYYSTLVIAALIIILFKPIQSYYVELIVNPILSKIESNYLIDILFIVFFYYFMIRKIRINIINKTYISGNQLLLSSLVIIFYLTIRISDEFKFIGFEIYPPIKYFDILILYFGTIPITVLASSFYKRKNTSNTSSFLISDSAIENKNQDVLERSYKAKRLTKEILEQQDNSSRAFGITGEWGSGKTSFLNLLKNELNDSDKKKELIILDFKPWLNLDTNSIISDFFNILQSRLRPYSEMLYNDLREYSNSIILIDKSNIIESFKNILNLKTNSNLNSDFDKINVLLKKLNKRVIIFIDDFDRLQANEIFEILRLIRNTAGFDNFVYIVAYDKNYVIKSLKKINIPNPEKYSEKIFIKEERLLPASQIQINLFLKENLKTTFPDMEIEIDKYFPNSSWSTLPENNKTPLKHLRDAIRFLNSFKQDYGEIKGNVVFSDYFNLKLLKFKFYDIYLELFLNRSNLLTDKGEHFGQGGSKYVLKNKFKNQSDTQLRFGNNDWEKSEIGYYLANNNLYSKRKNEVFNLMNSLFETKTFSQRHHLSIIFPKNYHIYFKDNLDINDLSETDFKNALNSNLEELLLKIDVWENEKKLELVKFRIYEIDLDSIENQDQYKKLVNAIFYIANIIIKRESRDNYFMNFDNSSLNNLISNRDNSISRRFFNNNVDELKGFILEKFNDATRPFTYESNFLNWVLNNNFSEENFILTKAEIIDIMKNYLFTSIDSSDSLNSSLWNLIYNCRIVSQQQSGNGYIKVYTYFDEVIEKFVEFLKHDLDNFLVSIVQPQSSYGNSESDNKIGVCNTVSEHLFQGYEEFKDWLVGINVNDLHKPSEFKDEFLEFFQKFEDNEFRMVEHDFGFQSIKDKLNS